MQIRISVVKGSKEGTYSAKYATSIGGRGQDKIKDAPAEKIALHVAKLIAEADAEGYVGKK